MVTVTASNVAPENTHICPGKLSSIRKKIAPKYQVLERMSLKLRLMTTNISTSPTSSNMLKLCQMDETKPEVTNGKIKP